MLLFAVRHLAMLFALAVVPQTSVLPAATDNSCAGFQAFFSGAGNPHAPGGAVFDSDGDGDVDFADFEAFAANLNGPGSGSCATRVNPFAFTGQRVDVLDGGALVVYDYKARVYDPLHGRFQQRDPAEFVDSYNLYEYAASRVTVLTDPTGELTLGNLNVTTAISRGLAGIRSAGAARRVLSLARRANDIIGFQNILFEQVLKASGLPGSELVAALDLLNSLKGRARAAIANRLAGDLFENAAGITGKKFAIVINGRTRIPDEVTEKLLREAKFRFGGELALSDAQATSMNWTSEHEEPPGG